MLEGIYVLKIKLELLSGLYIGGNDNGFDIGGADTDVIRNPLTKEPYIPGSSLKGKLKVLLKYNLKDTNIDTNKKDIVFKNSSITNIFETLEDESNNDVKISRAIFRDLTLTKDSKETLERILGVNCYTEIKAENKVNAISGKSDSPRFIERVPAGAEFEGEIVLNIFDGDDKKLMMDTIKKAIRLLEMNYLGGNGSRGYGRVKAEFNDFEKVEI
ncbi:type III-A CRISPR-associated RAMP protein Csm3 [Thomasclavelia sp.]|uniref:type III-A CRISPR-associated RAMP protein Csm3 n=1 Tax=Thomasclavelia sp. TaxID=3025757 RepID=UPI0025CC001B|nr:type III-A CRISPR-associated RAMP protein Csm3 [Thomasclavelia sp.]